MGSSSVVQRDIWVRVQEVPQRRDDLASMRNIVLPNGGAEIVHQHVPELFASAILASSCAIFSADVAAGAVDCATAETLNRARYTTSDKIIEVLRIPGVWLPNSYSECEQKRFVLYY